MNKKLQKKVSELIVNDVNIMLDEMWKKLRRNCNKNWVQKKKLEVKKVIV